MLLTTQQALAYTLPPTILRGSDPGVCGAATTATGTGAGGLMASVLATAAVGLDGVDDVESIFSTYQYV